MSARQPPPGREPERRQTTPDENNDIEMRAVVFDGAIRNDETVTRARELCLYRVKRAAPVIDRQ